RSWRGPGARHHRRRHCLPEPEKPGDGAERKSAKAEPRLGGQCFRCNQVKEGDRVKKGQLLAQLENVQSSADVNATRVSVQAAETDAVAGDAALKTSLADLNRAK